jgi:hypothetical protein
MTGGRRLVLLDNTVLTNFALVGQDNLPTRLWSDAACTTTAAYGEYLAGAAVGILPADAWRDLIQVALDEREEAFAARLTTQLGAGERSCLAVAISRSGTLASDDLLARRMGGRAWRRSDRHTRHLDGVRAPRPPDPGESKRFSDRDDRRRLSFACGKVG